MVPIIDLDAMSPSDSNIPPLGADTVVKIWNPFTGVLIRNLNGHTAGNSDIAWSPDGVFLASASDDASLRIWDVDSVRALGHGILVCTDSHAIKGITKKHLKGHNAIVFCCNYNTAGNLLVSGDVDGQVKIWDMTSSKGARAHA